MKEKNTFKYVSFNEQIAKISVDITKWRIALPTDAGDQETFFYEAINQWNDKDYGDHYKAFLDTVPSKSLSTYAQLLYNQKNVVKALLEQLSVKDGSSYITLLELTLALARDLREDFYEHLWDFIEATIVILEGNIQSVELLQTGFKVVTTLFKIYWRRIVTEIRKTFLRFVPLFNNKALHIRRFSTEAFAFFLRKSNAISKLIRFMVTKAAEYGDQLKNSVSFLILNAVKGVSKQFVSRTSELLNEILDAILTLEDEEHQVVGREIFVEAMRLCVVYTKREYSAAVTSVLIDNLRSKSLDGERFANTIATFLSVWITERRGGVFSQRSELFQCFEQIQKSFPSSFVVEPAYLTLLSQAIIHFHSDTNLALLPTIIDSFVSIAAKSLSVDEILNFFDSLTELSIFDLWISPTLTKYTEANVEGNELAVLSFYARFISVRRPFSSMNEVSKTALLDVSSIKTLKDLIVKLLLEGDLTNFDHMVYAVVIWPWIWKASEKVKGVNSMKTLLKNSLERTEEAHVKFSVLCAAALNIVRPASLDDLQTSKLVSCLTTASDDIWHLRMTRIVLTRSQLWKNMSIAQLISMIEKAFSSPHSECRTLALELVDLHIRSHFPKYDENAFGLMLKAERTPLTLQDYRSRALLFRRINPDTLINLLPDQSYLDLAPTIVLRILLAQYYENFTPYWPLVTEIISTFADGMETDQFWAPVFSQIRLCHDNVTSVDSQSSQNQVVCSFWNVSTSKVNFSTCRIQLFKLLSHVVSVCKKKTNDLSPLLLDIYKNEYCKFKLGNPTQNLLQEEEEELCVEVPDVVDDDQGEVTEQDVQENSEPFKGKHSRHDSQKALVAMLNLYSKFTRPRKVHSEPLIKEMYMELLLSGLEEIQKPAVSCLFTYQEKFLSDYKENIQNLLSPQKFNDELVKFSLDDQNELISEADRGKLMPYIMRIVFGLLHSHVTSKAHARRAAVYRFLSGCRAEELQIFLDITFRQFYQYCGDAIGKDASSMCDHIEQTISLREFLRLKWIKSFVNSVAQTIRFMVVNLTEEQFDALFRILLACGFMIRLASEKRAQIIPGVLGQLRDLRQSVNATFCQFFRTLQNKALSNENATALFDKYLEPACLYSNDRPFADSSKSLPEGITKIFLSFASVPSLFTLLNWRMHSKKWKELSGHEVTPMALLGSFLNCKSTNDRAAGEVLEGFKSLLHLNSDVNRQVVYEHQGCMKKIHGVSFGSQLVVTHIRPILGFLSMKLSAKGVCQPIYLDILHSVSEHITDSAICEVFSRTLLKVLKSGTSLRNDYVTNLLNTISKFVCKVEEPSSFIMNIFSLLPTTLVKESRKALVSVICSLKNNPNLLNGTLASQIAIIVDLESWDPRRVDEPDFEVRHAAFSALSRLCEASEQIDRNCLSAYVQVVSYSLRTASDLSLKSSASSCLGDLTRYVGKGVNHDQEILSRSFIPECLHGLHHKDEAIRLEFLSFLASLVRHCSFHSQLGKLRCLLSDDVETDFFAGAGHIQVHRRQRAFFALSRSIESNEVDVPVSVLIRFVFPIVHPYLLNFTSKTSALSDQALILFTTILKKASWSKYFFVLNGYIKQLLEEQDKDKPIIRVVVKIIDSFHFNVTDVEIPNDFTIASYSENKPEPDDYENEGKPEPDDHEDEGKLSNERNLFIIKKIVAGILPKLRKCIDGKGDQNLAHKKAEKYYSEDDDILRAPIALATVKLLKKLPPKILDQHLHGVILKLNSLILSRSYNVREVARKTMISVLQVLGTVYLPFVIREMKQIMNKGYQVHVMIYTVHVLISAMKEDLKSGDLDSCLLDIMEICKIDQFSDVTEEKSVGGIINHVAEAKAEKSIETYFFIGSFISKASLNVPVAPLMKIIEEKPQSKTIKTVSRLLDSYSSGLCSNQGIDVPTLLVFAYQTLTRYTAAVDGDDKTVQREEPQSLRPQSCLILPKAPTRIGVIVKASIKSKSFVFVEFALSLLNAILKRSKTTFTSEQLISHLDPFVQHVVHCLRLKYDRVVSNALRSIVSMLEHPLPQLKASISKIVESLFVLLADYAGMGRAGDKISVLELTQNLFKAFTRIIKDCPVEILTSKRIQILLTYMETDITDPHKQATAFSLLKAIVSKKISDEKLPPLMQHLSELSVLSHTANIRAQCRQVVIAFVANHPMGKDVEKFIEFFLAQLDYEHEDGRLSAIETLNLAFTTFVENVVDKFALVAFIRLSMGLVNESSQDCKRYMALALRNLVQFCSEKARNELCAVAKDWLNSNNDSSKFLAAKALMEFSEAVPTLLVSRVPEICKMISSMLTEEFIDESSEDTTVALFTLLSKLTAKYPAQVLQIFSAHAATFWENYRYFAMCMDSPLIQTASAEFLGQYFSASGSQQGTMKLPLEAAALGGFMFWQLKSNKIGENQSQQVIKNLVFLGKNSTDPEFYQFFAQKMKNVCKHEISHLPDQAIRRLSMFKLSAALFLSGSKDLTEELVSNMMLFFTRELNGKSDKYAEELKQLAAEVCDILKGVIGEKRYNDLLVDAQRDLTKRAGERKRQRKELAVLDPELAAQEKLRKHRARVVAQKRKIEEYKPYRKQKRLRREGSEEL